MRTCFGALVIAVVLSNVARLDAAPRRKNDSRMPIYVEPFYNEEGLKIEVGSFSKELKEATDESAAKLAEKMKKQWATLPIEAMYVMAIRLYDLGLKDDAVYWYYSAQYRARLFKELVPADAARLKDKPDLEGARIEKRGNVTVITGNVLGTPAFEAMQAHQAFFSLAGEYINGYAFGDLAKLKQTIKLVQSDNKAPPKFDLIYPDIPFIAANSWKTKSEQVGANLNKLLDYVENHADEINASRKKNLDRRASDRPAMSGVGEDTEFVGGPRGAARRLVSDDSMLYGVECMFGEWNGEKAIRQIVPIFARDYKRRLASGAVAREGYAVGAVNIYAQSYVNGIQLVFMRLRDDGVTVHGF